MTTKTDEKAIAAPAIMGVSRRPQGRPGQPHRVDGADQVAPDQREVGRLDGHIAAGADGDPEVGLSQRGRIVDAVPDHRDHLALRLQCRDDGHLLGRQHLRDPGMPCHCGCRSRVVAGEQHRLQAQASEELDGAG